MTTLQDRDDIARTIATGYPYPLLKTFVCEECERELYEGDLVFTWCKKGGGVIEVCDECFKDFINEMNILDLADELGFIYRVIET